jgi:hypothetical protein
MNQAAFPALSLIATANAYGFETDSSVMRAPEPAIARDTAARVEATVAAVARGGVGTLLRLLVGHPALPACTSSNRGSRRALERSV